MENKRTKEMNIKQLKQYYCQSLLDGKYTVDQLTANMEEIVKWDTPKSYTQAEAIKQALDWWSELDESPIKTG